MTQKGENFFLFSVDLEDVRDRIPDGNRYAERVPRMTEKYLRFLSDLKMKATFFIVGDTARRHPDLIKTIVSEGHEVACHSDKHVTLDRLTREEFKTDIQRNLDSLHGSGCHEIYGFRAATFSLTEKTPWAYEVLEDLGFGYSSSVLPAKNPLFGWEGFGGDFKCINHAVWELPITLTSLPFLTVPFAGGVYFRLLPYPLISRAFNKQLKENRPVLGYFHPYDIDTEQEHFMHPGLDNSRFYNFLMYYNRRNVFNRLGKIMRHFPINIIPYREYVERYLVK